MNKKWMLEEPLVVQHYELLKEIGIIDLVDKLQLENLELESLVEEAYEIFRKESVEELVSYVISCLSDKFIPSRLVFILNQGVMFNRINILEFHNLKRIESDLSIESLEPYEKFFRKYTETTSFLIFESEIEDKSLIEPLRDFDPQILVPVKGLSGLYGLIVIGPKVLGDDYTKKEISYINRLLKFTAVSIQNNIHYEHSVRDPKTGLYNHNFFIRRVSEEIARSKRTGDRFSIIMLDIDHFKLLNDEHGHLAGDKVILMLAELLTRTLREEDFLSRFGGEEFMILLPGAGMDSALLTAERLRTAVEIMETEYEGRFLKITASFGVACYDQQYRDTQELISGADSALYLSKSRGRNTCSVDNRVKVTE